MQTSAKSKQNCNVYFFLKKSEYIYVKGQISLGLVYLFGSRFTVNMFT